jgi:predicted DNA-binding protein
MATNIEPLNVYKKNLISIDKDAYMYRAMAKTMTLRLDDERAATLEMVARADEQTVTEAIRTAIDAHIEERRLDKEFRDRLQRRHEEERSLYERLAS